jgi:hypothetical protein
MPGWKPFADWMAFPYLDEGDGLDYAYTLAFKITDDWNERWTARFTRFKDKEDMALYGAASVMQKAFPALIGSLKLDPAQSIIVPALSSSERKANPKRHIPRIGKAMSNLTGLGFDATCLTKEPHKPLHSLKTAADRHAELEKANYAAGPIKAKVALIMDDFITQGATMAMTARKLKAANPGIEVIGIALAKNERLAWGASNSHVPAEFEGLWKQGEKYYKTKNKPGA